MTHYTSCIWDFGAADSFDTEHSEAGHKYHVKAFYGRTNKREGYENQICLHNTRWINMIAMEDILFHKQTRHTTQASNEFRAQVSVPARMQNLTNIGWIVDLTHRKKLHLRGLNTHFWRTAAEIASQIDNECFIDALAVFVRESRNRLDNIPVTNASIVHKESDPSWVQDFPVALHPSLRCWRRKGNNSNDLEMLAPEYVRCKPCWQLGEEWRRDYVWIQENEACDNMLDGRQVGQIQAIITVIDDSRRDDKGAAVQYTGAFIELLHLRDKGRVHHIHGMVEVEDWPIVHSQNPCNIGHCCFFDMSMILWSAHIVPTGNTGVYYINNYVDWDQYNTIFDPDFIVNGTWDADRIAKQYR